ncbi:MAG TPA: hypothetical protein PK280_00295 [Planctomycetota bacterium]|nr:hypothetical protein [Planctomycetota bacterium]
MMKRSLPIAAALILAGLASAGEISFSAKPTASKDGDKVKIAFTVAAPTDVEVAVLGADGKVVRHLAAGVLGAKNPPPEPLKPGLAQSLDWDGKDDFGKAAPGAKVRVRAGTGVKFGRTVSDSPYMLANPCGLAADDDGNVYVFQRNFGYGSFYLQVFSDEGKYVRTVLPPAADLPKESIADFTAWDEAGKRPVMRNYLDVYPEYLPIAWHRRNEFGGGPILASQRVTKESGIVFYWIGGIYRLELGGGTGGKPFLLTDPFLSRIFGTKGDQYKISCPVSAAVSQDGSTLYAVAPAAKPDAPQEFKTAWPAGRICSLKLDGKPGAVQDFATQGAGSLTTDAQGNVYAVTGSEIAVLGPDGKKLGALPVKGACRAAVHPKTGEIYVLAIPESAYNRVRTQLLKFSGWKEPKQLAMQDLGTWNCASPYLAVTVRGERTSVWVAGAGANVVGGGNSMGGGQRLVRGDLTRYDDRGDKFEAAVKIHEKDPDALGCHDTMAVDPATEDVYVNDDYRSMYRYNGLTGQGGNLRKVQKDFYATDLTVGPDGYLYVRTSLPEWDGPYVRLDRNLKPAPFPGSGTHVIKQDGIYSRWGAGFGEKGIGVGRDGKQYVTAMYRWTQYCVWGFGPDGKFMEGKYLADPKGTGVLGDQKGDAGEFKPTKHGLTSAIIGPIPKTNGGVRVDSRGNIYIGMALFPKEGLAKPEYVARIEGNDGWRRVWDYMVGSVVKFPPEGGEWTRPAKDKPLPEGAKGLMMERGNFLGGAVAAYPGVAPFSGGSGAGTGRYEYFGKTFCDCRSARFDLDRYDRLYLPNCVTNSVRVCDNAGNTVVEFGGYANYDSQYLPPELKDGKPAAPVGYIPLGWPIGTGVSDEHIYVCDQLNRSVVRVDKSYSAEETVDVK